MHASLLDSARRASEAPRSRGGRSAPPAPPPKTRTHTPEPGCVVSIVPFGKGVAYEVRDQVTNLVIDRDVAPDGLAARRRGTLAARRMFGDGEPVYAVEAL